ncbi:DEKNAAC103131, partial [Brettanomyces naardenensis]
MDWKLLFVLLGAALAATATGDIVVSGTIPQAEACLYGTGVTAHPGFEVQAYSYPFDDTVLFSQTDFLASDYTSSLVTQVNGVTVPSFYWEDSPWDATYTTDLYGMNVEISNLVLAYTGFFLAPESGIYTFNLIDIDDSGMVWLGTGIDCCTPGEITGTADEGVFLAAKEADDPAATDEAYIYLQAGFYYPMRLMYVDIAPYVASLDFEIITPSGIVISNFEDYIFQLSGSFAGCSSSIVVPPVPPSTVTGPWTGTFTTTTTSPTVETGTNGQPFTTSVIVVETPTVPLSTITRSWTGTFTSTTTSKTVETNSSGQKFTTSIVIVDTPTVPLSTIITPWTKTFTSTTTSRTVETDSNGSTFTTSVVVIDTPIGPSTITTPWTGTFTTTTTSKTVETDSN